MAEKTMEVMMTDDQLIDRASKAYRKWASRYWGRDDTEPDRRYCVVERHEGWTTIRLAVPQDDPPVKTLAVYTWDGERLNRILDY